ncbi:EAL domain-containing protein [bacterium]|nr:MAG: EAL domain-containing protein [bacterium]
MLMCNPRAPTVAGPMLKASPFPNEAPIVPLPSLSHEPPLIESATGFASLADAFAEGVAATGPGPISSVSPKTKTVRTVHVMTSHLRSRGHSFPRLRAPPKQAAAQPELRVPSIGNRGPLGCPYAPKRPVRVHGSGWPSNLCWREPMIASEETKRLRPGRRQRNRHADIGIMPSATPPPAYAELREFLRAHRARLRPQDVALPVQSRRRFPGLRAEDVAELAGVSTKWYLLFENGSAKRRFSLAFIQRVASALQLGPRERARYLRLALPSAVEGGPRSLLTSAQEALLRRRPAVIRGLRRALARCQLSLAYQPIWSADGTRITGVEALLRWRSADLGAVGPGEFVPIAEEVGLIRALGAFALREACQQSGRWRNAGLEIRLCVNISPIQLRSKNFARDVRRLLEQHGLPAHQLELEITEYTPLDTDPVTSAALEALRRYGIRIALDDFGTGFGSYRSLQQLRAHAIKIDRSFVANLPGDASSLAICRSITALAHDLGLAVVAEGVEHEDQRALLQAIGCDEMQGYLFSRPVSAEQCTALLESYALNAHREASGNE